MTTTKQREAAAHNITKAQKAWKNMSSKQRSLAQPEGRARTKPGKGGSGEYYHVVVRPKGQFTSFRTHDIGRSGHTQRVAGHRKSGSWATQKWLIHKDDAHLAKNGRLVIDDRDAKDIRDSIRGPIVHEEGDIFRAKPQRNVPEEEKPTPAQKKARKQNIRKAQKTR